MFFTTSPHIYHEDIITLRFLFIFANYGMYFLKDHLLSYEVHLGLGHTERASLGGQ